MNDLLRIGLLFAVLAGFCLPAPATAQTQSAIGYTDPVRIMQQGGPLMWPILLCSVATITFGLERAIALRRGRVIPGGFVRRFMHALRMGEFDRPTALAYCKMNPSPTANVFAAAVRYWGRPAAEIDRAVTEAGEREVAGLRRNLRALMATSNVATLLGLLGTVIGMIDAFNAVAFAKALGKAEVLAAGIAVALLTTAFGLVVAIPSIVLHSFFAARVERLVDEIDGLAGELSDAIAADRGAPAPHAPSHAPGYVPSGKPVPKFVS